MPHPRKHLHNIHRASLDTVDRSDYLRLDMNENVPGLPDAVIKKILSQVDTDYVARYPAYNRLQDKIANACGLQSDCIHLANGSDAAIKNVFEAYVSPGDKVILTDPTFAMYPVYCNLYQAEQVTVQYNDDFSFPFSSFYKALNKRVKMAVIVNPNNPTGSVATQGEILRILLKALKLDILVIIDEAYFYYYDETFVSAITSFDNLIVLRTFSKVCGMASLRIGFAAASPSIIQNLRKVRPTFDVNAFAVLFAERLVENVSLIRTMLKRMNRGKTYIVRQLKNERIEYREGKANFILIKCPGKADEIIRKLALCKILVGGRFRQTYLKDYIRVTIGDRVSMEIFWRCFISIWREPHAPH